MLRRYQKEMLKCIDWSKKINVFQAPTGAGKSIIMMGGIKLFNRYSQSVKKDKVTILIVSPRVVINNQLKEISQKYNVEVDVYTNQKRKVGNYDVVILDEAHHIKANTYKKLIEKGERIFCFTATPILDKWIVRDNRLYGLWYCFGVGRDNINYIPCPLSMQQLIDNNYLSKFSIVPMYGYIAPEIERARAVKNALQRELSFNEIVYAIPKKRVLRVCKGQTIVFCNSIKYCIELTTFLTDNNIKADYVVSQEEGSRDNDVIINNFKKGDINVLVGCNIFNEGFDAPLCETAIMLRPTNSLILYMQQIGRVLRYHKDKAMTLIYDFVGNGAYFGSPLDICDWEREFFIDKPNRSRTTGGELLSKECPVCHNVMASNSVRTCPYCQYSFFEARVIAGKKLRLESVWRALLAKMNIGVSLCKQYKVVEKEKGMLFILKFDKGEYVYIPLYKANKYFYIRNLYKLNELLHMNKSEVECHTEGVFNLKREIKAIIGKEGDFNVIKKVLNG